jgi:two-component system sensor histidine kinase DesK
VTNIVKHSNARQCYIECAVEVDSFTLTISDDGIGTDYPASANSQACTGLRGIRERLELVEGKLHVLSAPGKGTRVVLIVPRIAKNVKARECH